MRRSLSLVLSFAALSSCSAFVSKRQVIDLDGGHPATVIQVDGEVVGAGKASVALRRDRSHVVIFTRDGRPQEVRVIDHVWSTYGKLDALGSIVLLFPGLGLMFPGARALEPRALVAEGMGG